MKITRENIAEKNTHRENRIENTLERRENKLERQPNVMDPSKTMIIFTTRVGLDRSNEDYLFKTGHFSDFEVDKTLEEFRNTTGRMIGHPDYRMEAGLGHKLNGENVFSYLHLLECPNPQYGQKYYDKPKENLIADYLKELYTSSLKQLTAPNITNVIFMLHGSTDFRVIPSGFTNESKTNTRLVESLAKKTKIPNMQIYTFQHQSGYLAYDILTEFDWEKRNDGEFPATKYILSELEKFESQKK